MSLVEPLMIHQCLPGPRTGHLEEAHHRTRVFLVPWPLHLILLFWSAYRPYFYRLKGKSTNQGVVLVVDIKWNKTTQNCSINAVM